MHNTGAEANRYTVVVVVVMIVVGVRLSARWGRRFLWLLDVAVVIMLQRIVVAVVLVLVAIVFQVILSV